LRIEAGRPHKTEQDLTRFLGFRGASAVGGFLLLFALGSNPAGAQAPVATGAIAVSSSAAFDLRTQALISAIARSADANAPVVLIPVTGALAAVDPTSSAYPASPYSVTVHRDVSATGAASGQPLAALVDANSIGDLDEEMNCLATAVYFESKGEPLEGQLAVAQVVMNRAASGRYPASLCGVVKQHAQFSFVRGGMFPAIDASCAAWRKARAIARIAEKRLVASLAADVLWYHADYVTPRWRQALIKVEQIGAHIFYRA
jgi:N-acetylmuramoyl-L-alanine amidase